jgi:diaphanous 1
MYTEERQEDQEELHERTVGGECVCSPFCLLRPIQLTFLHFSTSSVPLPELIRLAQEHGDLYPTLINTVQKYLRIFERDIDEYVRFSPLSLTSN